MDEISVRVNRTRLLSRWDGSRNCRRSPACWRSYKLPTLAALSGALGILLCTGAVVDAAPDSLPSVAVLGIASAAKDRDWQEGLAGFGIENWVAQALYDTGKYRMLEEKAEVIQALQPRAEATLDGPVDRQLKDLDAMARSLGADFLALGSVKALFSRSGGISVGPFHSLERDTFIKVELSLYDARTGKIEHKVGQGKVGRSSHSLGADYASGRLPFDPSTVAPATSEAVERAVEGLVPGYRWKNRSSEPVKMEGRLVLGVLPLGLRPEVARLYPVLKSRRVSLGVHDRVTKAISAAGSCDLQEIDPEVVKALELQWWIGANGAPPADDVVESASHLVKRPDWIVYGEVFSFSVSQKEKLAGLSGSVKDEVTVGIQLRAVNPTVQPAQYCVASGMGMASGDWEAWKGADVDMEQSFVGQAASRAIDAAWPALLRDIAAHKDRRG